jgi:streptomycin 6-kinase
MDTETLTHWRQTIKRVLSELAAIPYPDVVQLTCKTVFDEAADIYLAIVEGWDDVRRLHGCLVHVEIKDGKIWIQLDGTEYGIAGELLAAGIPQDRIVLGFKSPRSRQYTGFAVA